MPSYPYPKLELKYCERCGGLWLRPRDSEAVYCATCEELIAELPPSRGRTPSGAMHAARACLIAIFAAFISFADAIGACA